MQEKIKKFSKKYLIGIVLGVFVFGIGGVYAATYIASNRITYDHSTSGMSATEVQGAIDELYNTCFPPTTASQVMDGLTKDPYECRYFFKGQNPNNYITFNGEKAGWRIISAECDGTIKIMRIKSIKSDYWDTNYSDNWASASLNSYLNGAYLNNQLNSTAKSQIVSHDWSIGAIVPNNNDLANQINDENSEKWNGKIALATVSEYIRTNSDSTCNTYIQAQGTNCRYNTWMFTSDKNGFWTLSPADVTNLPFYVNTVTNGNISHDTVKGTFGYGTAPTVYLSSDLTLSGSGTQSDPYTIN